MHSTTTPIQDIINRRVETGLADLLLTIYDAGYCAGAGMAMELPIPMGMADLVLLVEARHKAEVQALRGWCEEPRVLRDHLPAYLASLPQQADATPEAPDWLRAYAERQIALGDATPPPELSGASGGLL